MGEARRCREAALKAGKPWPPTLDRYRPPEPAEESRILDPNAYALADPTTPKEDRRRSIMNRVASGAALASMLGGPRRR